MYALSTGEPPTPPGDTQCSTSPARSVPNTVHLRLSADSDIERSQSLTAVERDSGYEPSPRSFADSAMHFFGDETLESADDNPEDSVFEDCPANFLLLELEDDDLCRDCGASSSCSCSRADSSATVRSTPIADRDLSNCDSSCSDQSQSTRPSSLPISIPVAEPQSFCNRGRPASHVNSHPIHSQPPSVCAPRSSFQTFISQSHPRSWPSTIFSWWNQPPSATAIMRMTREEDTSGQNVDPEPRLVRNQSRRTVQRSRRRQIDSDASSGDELSSDENCLLDDDLDDSYPEVFSMAEVDTGPISRISPLDQPLPDIILHSSPSVIRRNRSLSLNLPPDVEPILQDIGRSLRSLSDQFENRRGDHLARRRQTISGSVYCRRSHNYIEHA